MKEYYLSQTAEQPRERTGRRAMKLAGSLKKQAGQTESKTEKKSLIEKAGMLLTDGELDKVAGGLDGEGDVPDGEPEAIRQKFPDDITTLIR